MLIWISVDLQVLWVSWVTDGCIMQVHLPQLLCIEGISYLTDISLVNFNEDSL